MSYQKILVVLDGSSFSEVTLPEVRRISNATTKIHLFSVVDDYSLRHAMATSEALDPLMSPSALWTASQTVDEINRQQMAHRRRYLREVSVPLAQDGYRVTSEVVCGSVVDEIIRKAQQGFDTLVMATRPSQRFRDLLFGSITETIIRKMPCPILLVGASAGNDTEPKGHISQVFDALLQLSGVIAQSFI